MTMPDTLGKVHLMHLTLAPVNAQCVAQSYPISIIIHVKWGSIIIIIIKELYQTFCNVLVSVRRQGTRTPLTLNMTLF